MSLLYQKARLLGRMFRGVDFADGSGSIGGGAGELAGDAAGSGWGGSSGGKPGESNMAQAQAQQNLTPLSDRPDTRNQAGWNPNNPNPNNPTQTVADLERTENLSRALDWGVPKAMSMLAPGWGLAMTVGKAAANLLNGAPVTEVVSDVLPGYINGQINKATGGILGQATMAGNVLNSLTGSPQVPNIGREVVSGIIGRPSGGSYGKAAPATSAPSEGNGDTTIAQQATPAPAAQPTTTQPQDVNYASLGIDSAGWTRAGRNYLEKRNGMV